MKSYFCHVSSNFTGNFSVLLVLSPTKHPNHPICEAAPTKFTETPKDGVRASPEQALIPLWDEWWNLPRLAQRGTKKRMVCQKIVMESKLQYIWWKKRNLQEMKIKGQRISWFVFQHPTPLALPTCRPYMWSLWLRILRPIALKFHVHNLIGSNSTFYVWSFYLLHFVYFVVNVATYTIHGCYGYVPYQYLCFHPQQSVTSPQVKVSDEELDRYELEAIEHESVQDALLPSLKLTWHLKMDGWNTSFLLGWPIFRGYIGFRECTRWDVDGVSDGVSGLLHVRYRFRSIFPIFFEGVYCLPGLGSKTVEKVAIKSQICRARHGFSCLCSPPKKWDDFWFVYSIFRWIETTNCRTDVFYRCEGCLTVKGSHKQET